MRHLQTIEGDGSKRVGSPTFRVTPSQTNPVYIQINGVRYRITDPDSLQGFSLGGLGGIFKGFKLPNIGKSLSGLSKGVSGLSSGLSKGVSSIGRQASSLSRNISKTATSASRTLSRGVSNIGNTIQKGVQDYGKFVQHNFEQIGQVAQGVVGAAGGLLQPAPQELPPEDTGYAEDQTQYDYPPEYDQYEENMPLSPEQAGNVADQVYYSDEEYQQPMY